MYNISKNDSYKEEVKTIIGKLRFISDQLKLHMPGSLYCIASNELADKLAPKVYNAGELVQDVMNELLEVNDMLDE